MRDPRGPFLVEQDVMRDNEFSAATTSVFLEEIEEAIASGLPPCPDWPDLN